MTDLGEEFEYISRYFVFALANNPPPTPYINDEILASAVRNSNGAGFFPTGYTIHINESGAIWSDSPEICQAIGL